MWHWQVKSLHINNSKNRQAEKLDVMVVSIIFNMQESTHVSLTGVQAQNGKLWFQAWVWFGSV